MIDLQFVDPVSRAPLEKAQEGYRSPTGTLFPIVNGRPTFVSDALAAHMQEERTGVVNMLKTYFRRFPALYVFLIYVISPVCFTGLSAKRFLRRFKEGSTIISIGAGVHRYRGDIVNVDIFPYEGVDVVADAMALPIADNSVDGVICEYLLEHLPNPRAVITEIQRVLRPGGQAYIAVPFVYPFHASPNDFYRWSGEGLKKLCAGSTVVELGSRSGPTSTLVAALVTWTAITLSFGNEKLYGILAVLLQLVFFPLKVLDLLLAFFPTSMHGTASVFIVIRKA